MKIPNFVSGLYSPESKVLGNEVLKNLYVESMSKSPGLVSRPGFILRNTSGSGPIRRLFSSNDRMFAVSGTEVYEIFSTYSSILRGVVANDDLPVSIASNRFALCIASADNGYIYDLTANTVTNISTPMSQVVFADGYFVGITPDSQIIRMSGQYDGLTWDPLDFTSAEGDPDNIKALSTDHRQVWTFGEESTEPFYDSGATVPFERVPGALLEIGTPAANSVMKQDQAVFLLGTNKAGGYSFWRIQGMTPLWVSNPAIDELLESFATVSDCVGYPYRVKGHAFCVWNFPTAKRTLVYDALGKTFSEWSCWNKTTSVWDRFAGQTHCTAWGKQFIGDHASGNIYEIGPEFYDDNGSELRVARGVPLPSNANRSVFVSNVELIGNTGQGIDATLVRDDPGNAQVTLRYSKDGGMTFGADKTAYAGKQGQYDYRCRWPGNFGQARKPYLEISCSDPQRIAWTELHADLEAGIS